MFLIVGSGPSAISAAIPLVEAGHKVHMIDGGQFLEEETRSQLASQKQKSYDQWDSSFIRKSKGSAKSNVKGLQLKLSHGSDYPYRMVEKNYHLTYENCGQIAPTLAVGGYSSIWGCAVMPYTDSDLEGWPITANELQPYYSRIGSFVPIVANNQDDLAKYFPVHLSSQLPIRSSQQANEIKKRYRDNSKALNDSSIYLGDSRLALKNTDISSCEYCGMCLHGCPKDLLFSTTEVLTTLLENKNFSYERGTLLKAFTKVGVEFEVELEKIGDSVPRKLTRRYSNILLGAGPIATPVLVLQQLKMFDQELKIKVSEYFMQPLFSVKNFRSALKERLHTLAQIFIELKDPKISNHWVHMQLYTYNEIFAEVFGAKFRKLGFLGEILKKIFLGRLMVIQGYLHSDESSYILMKLSESGTCHLAGINNAAAKKKIFKAVTKLLLNFTKLGFLPVLPLLSVGPPGEGRHIGGAFPMSADPKGLQTSPDGELALMPGLFIIDSSNFPSIPAPTITYTVMANAYRIGSNLAKRLT